VSLGDSVLGGKSGDFKVSGEAIRSLDLEPFMGKDTSRTTSQRYVAALARALGPSVTIVGADSLPEPLNVPMSDSELNEFKGRAELIVARLAGKYLRDGVSVADLKSNGGSRHVKPAASKALAPRSTLKRAQTA